MQTSGARLKNECGLRSPASLTRRFVGRSPSWTWSSRWSGIRTVALRSGSGSRLWDAPPRSESKPRYGRAPKRLLGGGLAMWGSASWRPENGVRQGAEKVVGLGFADVTLGVMTSEQRAALIERLRGGRAVRSIPFGPDSLTRVIVVTSGKGGVGKSTVTANLAVALAARGLRVGLIDADIHGFSIPGLLGMVDATGIAPQPTRLNDLMLPPVAHGVKVISIGMFLERSTPDPPVGSALPSPARAAATAVAWRGPMLHRTLTTFLTEVYFGDLDILLLDMPPGTGDVAISLGQLLPHAEVIIVTTPQPAAAEIAERSGV